MYHKIQQLTIRRCTRIISSNHLLSKIKPVFQLLLRENKSLSKLILILDLLL